MTGLGKQYPDKGAMITFRRKPRVCKGTTHLLNTICAKVDHYEIYSGVQFRMATPAEIEGLEKELRNRGLNGFGADLIGARKRKPRRVTVGQFRGHFVLDHSLEFQPAYPVFDFQSPLLELALISRLTMRSEIRLGPYLDTTETPGMTKGYAPGEEFDEWPPSMRALGQRSLSEIANLYAKFRAIPEEYRTRVYEALTRVLEMDHIRMGSGMKTLGYVSIIESLVARKPDEKDPVSSIKRQMRKKLLLISRRCRNTLPLPYGFFCNWNEKAIDKLWSAIYDFRSVIAHGGAGEEGFTFKHDKKVEFDLARLNKCFIIPATHSIIRFALCEPELLADLKEV